MSKASTPASTTSTISTKTTSTTGTLASLTKSTKRTLNLGSPGSNTKSRKIDKDTPIEKIDFLDVFKLKSDLTHLLPNRIDEINKAETGAELQRIALESYETKVLKSYLCVSKVKYGITDMGGIEEDVSKTKQQLIKDLLDIFDNMAYRNVERM